MSQRFDTSVLSVVAMAAAVLAVSQPAAAASFDCTQTRNAVERRICQSPDLSALDSQMDGVYRSVQARIRPRTDVRFLRADQLRWLAKRDDCWTYRCVRRAYVQRIDTLQSYAVIRDD
jgi:uncharacterized protein